MFFVPESPRWLVKAGKADRARAMLQRIGSAEYAGQTLKEIEHTLQKIITRSRGQRCYNHRSNRS